jgi:hypothetical protein
LPRLAACACRSVDPAFLFLELLALIVLFIKLSIDLPPCGFAQVLPLSIVAPHALTSDAAMTPMRWCEKTPFFGAVLF